MDQQDKKHVYKAVRNLVLNELSISKKEIDEMINDRIDARIDHFLHSTNLDKLLLNQLRLTYKDEKLNLSGNYWSGQSVTDFIKDQIKKEFASQIQKQVEEVLSNVVIKKKE